MANDSATLRNAPVARTTGSKTETAAAVDTNAITQGLKTGTGMKGTPDPAVNVLQQALNEQNGAGLKCDGRFGPKTEAAVRAFQEKNGIEPSGVICNETLAKIQGKTTAAVDETAAADEAPEAEETKGQETVRPQASQTDVEQSRSKMKSREELMRARVAGAEKAENEGQGYEVVTDRNVSSALEGVSQMRGSLDDQRRQVSSARLGVQNDIRALAAKKGRTDPEEMLLTGKRQQDEVLGQLEKHIDTKKMIVDAAGEAVSDGIITEKEDEGISIASEKTQQIERMLAIKAKAADAIVTGAERLGATIPARASTTSNQPAVSNQPRVSNEPAVSKRPAVQNQPRVANQPVANQPVVANKPAVVTKPAVANQPAVTKPAETFAQLSQRQVDDAVESVRVGNGNKKGTVNDPGKVLSALDGMSPNQVKQVEDGYNKRFAPQGYDFQKDVVGNLNPPQQKAVAALRDESKTAEARTADFKKLSGEGAALQQRLKTDATTIYNAAANRVGTDEETLFKTLDKYAGNKEEFALLEKAYAQIPMPTGRGMASVPANRNLREDVKDDLSGDELVRGTALMDQNRPLANAAYAHEVLTDRNVNELTRHLNSIPAADRKAFADAFKKQYGASLSSNVDATTRAAGQYLNPSDMAKLLDAVKAFPAAE